MQLSNFKYSELTEQIIQCFYSVYNRLGYGFLEKVYENALSIELDEMEIENTKQYPIDVLYKGKKIGSYFADILVENKVIIELKASKVICKEHEAQLTNYLKATNLEVGLLLNFGIKPQVKRKVFSNLYKNHNLSYRS